MPRGGYRPGAGRPRKGTTKGSKKRSESAHDPGSAQVDPGEGPVPLDYMLSVMRDPNVDAHRRDRMAIAAAPFVHRKQGEGGKKDSAREAAEKAAGGNRFAPAAPPPGQPERTH